MKKKAFVVGLISLLAGASLVGCGEKRVSAEVNQKSEKEWWEYTDVGWEEHTKNLSTGVTLSYLTLGKEDGKPVVLIHGATDSRLSWAQVAPVLAENGYHVYIPELRGHGKTSTPIPENGIYSVEDFTEDIKDFIDSEKIKKPNIVGHSLGTLIAQRLAAEIPDNVATITLIATGAKSSENETIKWILDGDGEEFLGINGYSKEKRLPDDFLRSWTETSNEDENFKMGIYEHVKQIPYDVWLYLFRGLDEFDNTDGLADIKVPVQIIWGTGDTLFLENDQKELIEGLVNAEEVKYETIEGASHNVHWDSIEIASKISKLIADFSR